MSDVLGSREKENKALEHELQRIFLAVNVEEDSTSQEGRANLNTSLCEQVGGKKLELKDWKMTRRAIHDNSHSCNSNTRAETEYTISIA